MVKVHCLCYVVLLVMLLCIQITCYSDVKLDVLLPYPNGGHKDSLRTYRYVRNCQNYSHGNRMHESIKPIKTSLSYELKYIATKANNILQFGHRTVVKNPLKMLSVLEPLRQGSCSSQTLAYVSESAKQQNCLIAINAGFFNPNKKNRKYGECLGNVISNGRFVRDSGGVQNANFGIRSDGTVVVGYLSLDEVMDKKNPFLQLITGVGWVLRNGEVYLSESLKSECKDLETTGELSTFFNVEAARTLIGHDKNGHVHLIQFDGKTDVYGINLQQAAEYMKTLGIINAINLDGGGSATYVAGSTVINYPSNECLENHAKVLCQRNVSTIICIHDGTHHETVYNESIETLRYDSNRNYGLVILLTVFIGILMLSNVYLCNAYMAKRSHVRYLTSSTQKKEALRSLLEERHSSDLDSEEEGL